MEGNNKVVLEVKIKPTALGEVNITVGASVDQRADNECGISPVDVDVSRRSGQGRSLLGWVCEDIVCVLT